MSALQYNMNQNYDPGVIKRIQRTVGSPPDGKWGRRTVTQIRAWQERRGLPADGKVGPGTLEQFEKLWADDEKPEGDEDLDDATEGSEPRPDHDHDDDDDDGSECTIELGESFGYFDADLDLDQSCSGDTVIALCNDMFAFGFTNDQPVSKYGKTGASMIAAFQKAAQCPHRVVGCKRVEVPVTFKLGKQGIVDANTRAEIRLWKQKGYRFLEPGSDFFERRVMVKNLGTLPRSSALLRDIPSTGDKPRKLHCLAAVDLEQLIAACKADTGIDLRIQSGWRRHRWNSRKHYEETVIKRYGSVREGRKWLAYSSPHETGLAVDFGTGGLEPKSKTAAKQRETPAYKWLVANAYRFGFHPYKREPWHWEHPLSLRAWTTGLSDWRLADKLDEG